MTNVIDPVKLCCGRRGSEHVGALCPTGTFMCCICFGTFPADRAMQDENGTRWNVCPDDVDDV